MSAIPLQALLGAEAYDQASRVIKITCKNSGEIINKTADPSQKWHLLAWNAIKKPDEFEVTVDELMSPVDVEGNIVWEEPDLRIKSMPELRKIGQGLSVTSNSKEKIIELILKKQKMLL
jgi:hypothetical protein